jgi:hypothetical protein
MAPYLVCSPEGYYVQVAAVVKCHQLRWGFEPVQTNHLVKILDLAL